MEIARRTVNTHRQNAYRLLKKLMGVRDDQLSLAATGMSNATHTRMIPYPVIEAAVKVDVYVNFSIQDAVNEVIRQLFSSSGSPELLYIAALGGGQAVTKTATTVPMWMKNFADAWKQN